MDVLEAEADVGAEQAFSAAGIDTPANFKFGGQVVEVGLQIGRGAGDDGLDV